MTMAHACCGQKLPDLHHTRCFSLSLSSLDIAPLHPTLSAVAAQPPARPAAGANPRGGGGGAAAGDGGHRPRGTGGGGGGGRDNDSHYDDDDEEGGGGSGSDAESYRSGEGTDYSDSDFEGNEGYRRGGYHPVHVGEVYNARYEVLSKLGWGHFSTVWLCADRKTGERVALKVQKSAEHYMDAAFDEIEILKVTSQRAAEAEAALKEEWALAVAAAEEAAAEGGLTLPADDDDSEEAAAVRERVVRLADLLTLDPPAFTTHVVRLVDNFLHTGPHGTHMCMVFETLGDNLLALIKAYRYQGIPLGLVRKYTRQVAIGMDFLHRVCGIIHTDLKPENVLLTGKVRRRGFVTSVAVPQHSWTLPQLIVVLLFLPPSPPPSLPPSRSCPPCPRPPRSRRAWKRWRCPSRTRTSWSRESATSGRPASLGCPRRPPALQPPPARSPQRRRMPPRRRHSWRG